MTDNQVLTIVQFIIDNWELSSAWPDFTKAMRLVLPGDNGGNIASKGSDRWALLPRLCCQASGGDPDLTEEVSAAWFLLYIAAHLVDKVEDRDQADEVHTLGGPESAINVANGLFLSAALILNKLYDRDNTKDKAQQISTDFLSTILVMTSGQHRDINKQELTLGDWWKVAEAKSGSFFSLACRCGSQLAIDDPARIKCYSDYGFHLGMMLQIRDDFEDLKVFIDADSSVNLQKSLALAYALEVLPNSERSQLRDFSKSTHHQRQSFNSIIEIFNQSGAGFYMLAEMERHYELGRTSLEDAGPISPAGERLASMIHALKLD